MRQTSIQLTIAAIAASALLAQITDAEANNGKNAKGTPSATPYLALAVDRETIEAGDTVLVSWATANVGRCMASGAWSGRQKESGSYRSPQLTSDTTYTLTCATFSGSIEQTVTVAVSPVGAGTVTTGSTATSGSSSTTTTETTSNTTTSATSQSTTTTISETSTSGIESTSGSSSASGSGTTTETSVAPSPKLQLTASASIVQQGESVTLTWSSEGVTNCQASGSWSGAKSPSGSEIRSALSASENYILTCDSASGQTMAMTSVQVSSGGTQITWQPPSQYIDGTQLAGLSAYRIYVGSVSQTYDHHIELTDPTMTQHVVDLPPGEHYIAMTAIDLEGNESPLSNEVHKIVQ